MRRERTSSTLASCNLPSAVSISVPSPNQRWLIRRAVKSRLTRSGACQRPLPGRVELRRRRFASALDNSIIESWHSTLEFELRSLEKFETKAAARARVAAWLDEYNRTRRQSSLGMIEST